MIFCFLFSNERGSDAAMRCLFKGISSQSMGSVCQKHIIQFQKITREDVELRPIITRTCSTDMRRLCSKSKRSEIVSCLRDNVRQILNSDCKELVEEEIVEESRSIDLNPEMVKACATDLDQFCGSLKDKETGSYGVDGEVCDDIRLRTTQFRKVVTYFHSL